METNKASKPLNFGSFLISYVSLSVIAGLFTFRLISSFLDTILLPFLDITVLPTVKFHKLTKSYDHGKNHKKNEFEKEKYIYIFQPGIFLKELVIWCMMMIILYFIYKIANK